MKKTQHWKQAKAQEPEVLEAKSRRVVVKPPKGPMFPARIFVKWEDDSVLDHPYLVASKHVDGFEDEDRVAVYELVEQHTLKVTRKLT